MVAARQTFAGVITGSKWSTVYAACYGAAEARRGVTTDGAGLAGARLSNAEAVQLIRGWSDESGRPAFPLWYQFAAVAYGWDPTTSDTLDASLAQGDSAYPPDATVMLWQELRRLATDMESGDKEPRVYTDGTFVDPVYVGDVRAQLLGDGAQAQFKIPIPGGCKDPKTGRPVMGPRKNKDGKWTCDPVTVDDPITYAGKSFVALALILGAVWFLTAADNTPRRRRRMKAR